MSRKPVGWRRHLQNYVLGDSQNETIRKIQQVFGDDAMGVTQIKESFN
jgi:hypothetical protein